MKDCPIAQCRTSLYWNSCPFQSPVQWWIRWVAVKGHPPPSVSNVQTVSWPSQRDLSKGISERSKPHCQVKNEMTIPGIKNVTHASRSSVSDPSVSRASSTSPARAKAVAARTLTRALSLSLSSTSSPSISTDRSRSSSKAASAFVESAAST